MIVKGIKGAIQKAVAKVNIADHFKEPGNADKRVYFLTIVQAGNLDFPIAVNFLGGVFERCHNCLVFVPETRPVGWVSSLTRYKGRHLFLITKSFFIIFTIFSQKKLFRAFFRFKGLSRRG